MVSRDRGAGRGTASPRHRLIDESAPAFDRAVAELEGARIAETKPTERRDWRLGEALRRAADAPLAVAEVAADTAGLAAAAAAGATSRSVPTSLPLAFWPRRRQRSPRT